MTQAQRTVLQLREFIFNKYKTKYGYVDLDHIKSSFERFLSIDLTHDTNLFFKPSTSLNKYEMTIKIDTHDDNTVAVVMTFSWFEDRFVITEFYIIGTKNELDLQRQDEIILLRV